MGLGLLERLRAVDFTTAEDLEDERSKARVLCSMREAWCAKSVSVLGRVGDS